jgi:hypothetical protein
MVAAAARLSLLRTSVVWLSQFESEGRRSFQPTKLLARCFVVYHVVLFSVG